jgi:hypothetical protein
MKTYLVTFRGDRAGLGSVWMSEMFYDVHCIGYSEEDVARALNEKYDAVRILKIKEVTHMPIYGTNHFESMDAARRYYADYGFTEKDVDVKFLNKEIRIGKPKPIGPERVFLNKEEGRYYYEV